MARLPDLEAWAVFARVAETGSFSRAAQLLGVSKSTVSKAVARLELRLGAALLNRTSRRLSLTEFGRTSAARAATMLADAEELEAAAVAQSALPSGRVRLAAPMSFGLRHVVPLLPDLLTTHPKLSIDLHLSDELVDLVGGGFDMALRIAELEDSSLRARRICAMRLCVVAAPAYLARHGTPLHPRDLLHHACFSYAYLPTAERWHFMNAAGGTAVVSPAGPLRFNNGDAALPALRAGLGLAALPEFMVWEDLQAGRLVPVMQDWWPPPGMLNIVTPPSTLRPAANAAVMGFLVSRLSAAPWAQGSMP